MMKTIWRGKVGLHEGASDEYLLYKYAGEPCWIQVLDFVVIVKGRQTTCIENEEKIIALHARTFCLEVASSSLSTLPARAAIFY